MHLLTLSFPLIPAPSRLLFCKQANLEKLIATLERVLGLGVYVCQVIGSISVISIAASMAYEPPTLRATWDMLHDLAISKIHPHPTPAMRTALQINTIVCPLIGLLYLTSGIKRFSQTGFWVFRIDSAGYMYPNTGIVTPFWGCLYTISQPANILPRIFLPRH